MKVIRKVSMEVEHFEIGDQIKIKLKGAGKFTATCHKITNDGALFVFDNCVARKQMNDTDTTEGGFDESDLCTWLNTEFIDRFPNKYIKRIVRPEGCEHLLWLLSEEQVFGSNLPFDDQLELMRDPKHRVCSYPDGSRATGGCVMSWPRRTSRMWARTAMRAATPPRTRMACARLSSSRIFNHRPLWAGIGGNHGKNIQKVR